MANWSSTSGAFSDSSTVPVPHACVKITASRIAATNTAVTETTTSGFSSSPLLCFLVPTTSETYLFSAVSTLQTALRFSSSAKNVPAYLQPLRHPPVIVPAFPPDPAPARLRATRFHTPFPARCPDTTGQNPGHAAVCSTIDLPEPVRPCH